MKITVIGGSGFIASHLIRNLLASNFKVKIFDKSPSHLFPELVTIGDVRNQQALNLALKDTDIVINLAAEHRDDVTPRSLYYDVNVQGAKNIVEAAQLNGIKKIVFTSSVAVYGLNKPDPDEQSPAEPFNDYGKSKLEAEYVFTEWCQRGEENSLTIIRPVVVFGEGNRGNVYNLIKQIANNKFMMVGVGNNCKSMAYVGNLAKFLASATEFGPGMHIFNFATKPDMTVRELVTFIRSELGMIKPLTKLPYTFGLAGGFTFDVLAKLTGKKFPISSIRIRKFCANTTVSTKALDALGFIPPFTLQEGLKRMVENLDQNIYFEGGG